MALFCVTYDLVKDKDYKRIIERLKKLGGQRPAMSVWFVDIPWTKVELRDDLLNHMDDDDKLIVVEFSKRPATHMAFKGTKEWLDAHVG